MIDNYYLREFSDATFVVKASGGVCEDPAALIKVVTDLATLVRAGIKCVFVYGGGEQLEPIWERYNGLAGIDPDTQLRITPDHALQDIFREREEIGGEVMKHIKHQNIPTELLPMEVTRARRMPLLHGTGTVIGVQRSMIEEVLRRSVVPVIGFGGEDEDKKGTFLNTTADMAASIIATEIDARKMIMVGRTDGVQNLHGRKVSFIDHDRLMILARTRRANGQPAISGGMLQKVLACMRMVAVSADKQAHVVGYDSLLTEILTKTGEGTLIERDQNHKVVSAEPDDLNAIMELHEEASTGSSNMTMNRTTFLKPLTPEEHAALLPNTLVLKHRGTLIAKLYWRELDGESGTVEIGGIAVSGAHQGEQHGQLLFRESLIRLKDLNFNVVVSITASNRLKKFYKELGMQQSSATTAQTALIEKARMRYGSDASQAEIFHLKL